jgi:hypothetical protein
MPGKKPLSAGLHLKKKFLGDTKAEIKRAGKPVPTLNPNRPS